MQHPRALRKLIAITASAILVLLMLSSTALAQDDDFNLGDGHEGAVTISTDSVPNALAPVTAAVPAGATTVTLGTVVNNSGTSGSVTSAMRRFEGGRLVMIYQPNDFPSGSAPSGDQTTIDLSNANVGRWELARITGTGATSYTSGNTITFTQPLVNSFTDAAILVTIPEWTTVTLQNYDDLFATAWNGTRGGVVGFLATGAITMGTSSRISAEAMGFRAGAAAGTAGGSCTGFDDADGGLKGEGIVNGVFGATFMSRGNRANGAGGGNCENAGGGGGGNAGQGGIGGDTYGTNLPGGLGGAKLSYSAEDHAVLGGGGGGGQENNSAGGGGGDGGGFVFVRGASLSGTGSLIAAGENGENSDNIGSSDGAGGGGAGGVIYARFSGSAVCTALNASGGAGGNEQSTGGVHGPGGGGGGGRIYFQRGSGAGCTTVEAGNGVAGVATQAGTPRNAGPSTTTDPVYTGVTETPSGGFVQPTVAITNPVAASTVNGSPTFSGAGTPNGATVYVYEGTTLIGSATVASGTWSFVPSTPLTSGAHTVTVKSKHLGAWNDQSTPITRTFTVDATPPAAPMVTRTAPASTPSNSTSATITYSGIESGATAQCSTNSGASWATCSASPVSLTGLTDGVKTYSVRQIDTVGNVGSVSTVSWTVDATGPPAPSVSQPANPTNSQSASITFSNTESPVTHQCSVNGGAFSTCTSPQNLTGLAAGTRTFAVRSLDALGNIGSATTVSWVIDLTAPAAPTVTRTAPTTSPTNTTSATISYTPNEGGGTIQCSTDGSTWSTCTGSPVSLTGLTNGTKNYYVRQLDAAGNTGATASVSWIVDTVAPAAPTVTRTTPSVNPTNSTSQTITLGGIESGATAQCSTDNSTWATCASSPLTLTGLTDGTKNYYVRQIDSAGNVGTSNSVTWVVDTALPVAPTVTRTVPTASPTISTSQTITYSGIESGATAQCSTDGGTIWTTCTGSPVNLTALSDGTKTYSVRQIDSAGNTGSATTVSWIVDTTAPAAPTVTRTSPTATPTTSTSQTITYSGIESGATAQCSTNGTTYTTCPASPVTLTGLTDGVKSYHVRQVDAAGNTGAANSVTWTVDTAAPSAPTVSRTAPASSPTNTTTATIEYSGIESGATAQCSTDGTSYSACVASPISLTGLTPGAKSYFVRQVDAAGNVGAANSVSWTIDTTLPVAPTVTRTAPASSPTNATTATITYSGIESGATAQCSTDGSTYTTCAASPVALSALTDGVKSYYVRQIDLAGNVGPANSVTWTVDTAVPVAPTVTRTLPTSTPTSSNSATITYSGIESGATAQCSTDGTTYTTCAASPVSLSGLTEGVKNYFVRQVDTAGNVSTASSVAWTIDNSAPAGPTVTRTAPASSPSTSTSATITYSGIESGATAQCSTDGTTYTTCAASPITLSGLTEGVKNYFIRQVDAAGNVSAANSVTWTVDTTPPAAPTVTRTVPATTPTNSTSASITYSGIESGATAQCSTTGGTSWATCAASPVSLSGLSEGAKTYSVRQIDSAGNVGSASTVTWTVDTTVPAAPTVTRTAPATTPTNTTTATITYAGIESGATAQCSSDGTTYTTCAASPIALSGLSDGVKNYFVRQIDAAGNTGTANSVSWTVDTAAPAALSVTRTAPAASPTNSTSATITYSAVESGATAQCSSDGSTYAACAASPVALSSLTDGAKTYYVRQVDSAGNVGPASSVGWTVDTAPPSALTVTRTAPTTSPTNSTSATITYSAVEPGATAQCSTDGGSNWSTCGASPVSLSGLTSGAKTYSVRQVDTAGNAGSATTVSWTIDTTPPVAPTVARTAPVATPTNSTSATITYSGIEPGATAQCSTDGTTYVTCAASPISLSALTDGAKTYYVRQVDNAGNTGPASSVTWTVDTAPPAALTVTRTAPATSPTNSTSATITYSVVESGATAQCSTDGGTNWTTCGASPVSLSGLTAGAKSYSVRQVDAAGNAGAATTVSWTIDTTAPAAPTVTRTAPVSSPTNATTATITYSGIESGATAQCSTDGTTYTTCSASPINLTGQTNGVKTYYVRQVDTAGNTGAASSVTWTVDTTPPVAPTVTRTAPTSTPTMSTSATITFGGIESGATAQCSTNGTTYTTCTASPIGLSGLTDGAKSYFVRQVDAAGNTGPANSVNWTVDTAAPAAPTVTRTAPVSTPSNSTSATITYSGIESGATAQCSTNGTTYTTCAASPISLTGLTDGAKTYYVRQTDAAGNVGAANSVAWTVDTALPSAPTVVRTAPTSSPSSSTSATITYSGIESGATAQCSTNGTTYTTCAASPIALTGLSDGAKTYYVRQVDAAGNTGAASSVSWTVDTNAPSAPVIASPTGSPHYSATATPTFSGTAEIGSTINLYNGVTLIGTTTANGSGNWSITSSALIDGSHAVTASATDSAGNTGSPSATITVVSDTATPTVAISAPANGGFINTPAATVTFSITDANPGANSSCQVDGGAFAPCTSGFTTSALGNGSHTITVQHTDLAGNSSSSTATFTVDNATPIVTITSPTASGYITTSTHPVDFAVTDDSPSVSSMCTIDGNAPVACTDGFVTPTLADGSHTITVSHTDSAGNTGSAAVTYTIDTQAPSAPTITGAPADPISSDEAEFTFSGAETGGSFECSIDGSAFTACVSPDNFTALDEGDHEYRVRQRDAAGNAGAVATHNWTVDTIAPNAPTLNGPNANTNNPESTVSFAGSPDTVELRCSFDGAPTAICPTSPLSLGVLADGSYSFTVEAFDAAGNSASNTINWNVDTVAPDAPTITSGPVGSVPSPDSEFEFTGAEGGGIYRCSIDSLPAANCTSPHEINGLADGTYTFYVRQVDAAGNSGAVASRTWTIDTTPPAIPTVTGPSSPSGQTSAEINFSSSESGVSFQCEVDGGGYAPCTDPLSLNGLSDGSHTVSVRVFDDAGNGSAPGTFTWEVDSSLFSADISGAPSGVVNGTSASLTLSASLPGSTFECSFDGSAFSACDSPVSLSGLTEGPHSFSARALNGSQTTPDVTRNWTVDLTNPGVSISAPIGGSTTGAATSIVFSTSDLNAPITTTCKLDSASPAPCTSAQAYTDLSEGSHSVVVTATDAGGNSGSAIVTWQVDHTAPAAPQITQPSADTITNDTTPTVSGTAEAGSTIKLFDGAALVATLNADGNGDWSWTPATELSPATYDFNATATDTYDNESDASAVRSVTVDTSAPAKPVLTSPATGPTNDSTPLASGTAEPGSTVTVYVDANPIAGTVLVDGAGDWEKLISPALVDGPHTITAIATDIAGNDSPASDDLEISVDTAAPSVSITNPGESDQVNTDSPEITFISESGATANCQIDNGPLTACTSPFSPSGLGEGSHTVTIEATDSAGNVATAVATFTVDLTDPTAELTGGPSEDSESTDDTPTFTFTSNEPGSFECSVDGSAFAPCTSPFTLPSLGEGPHTFTVRSIDEAGNPSGDITRNWTVDTVAPTAPSIDSPADGAAVPDNTPTVSGLAGSAEAASTISVYIDGVLSGTTTADPDGSWNYTVPTALDDETYAFTATATDGAGNTSPASSPIDIRVDANDPTVELTGKPGPLSNDATPTFTFSADEPSTFECSIDGNAFAACATPFTTAALVDGAHTFEVRAIDAGGNASASEQWAWTSDTTPPNVTVTSNSPAAGISPTFSFTSDESGTTYKCRIDGIGAFTTCSSPFNAPTLAIGNHTLQIEFTDAAGNSGTKTVNFAVAGPTAQPQVSNPAPAPAPSAPAPASAPAPTCKGSGDEPGVPANMTVVSASVKKNTIKFTTSSDKYILVRVAVYQGKKLVGQAVRANNPGKRIVAVKTKKAVAKGKKFTIKLSAITMTGGKSVATTYMVTDKKGKATLVGADGTVGAPAASTISCGAEKGGKKVKVKIATAVKVKAGVKKLKATAKATDWTIATFRVVQNGKTVGRRVFLLKPGKQLRAQLKLSSGKTLVKGKAMIQVSTCTVDGVWQQFKKPIKVK